MAALGASPTRSEAPLVPLSNVEGERICYPGDKHLYQRGGIYFCTAAANLTRWPKRVSYAVLGIDAAHLEPQIAAAVADAHTITGADLVRDATPDLVIFLETEMLDDEQIHALASQGGVHLSDAEVHRIKFAAQLVLKPGRHGGGGGMGSVFYFDARKSPGQDDNAFAAEIGRKLREYVLAYFDVERPAGGFICTDDKAREPSDPTEPTENINSRTCALDHILMRRGDETFCARPIPYWPHTFTYAAIGPGVAAHEAEIAVAAARFVRLTGRAIVAGDKPDVVIALVDRPFDDDSLRTALAGAHVAAPPVETSYLMTSLSAALYASTPRGPTLFVRTEYCDIKLEQVIRIDGRPPAAIRQDIDDTFRRILEIGPPARREDKR